MHDLVIRQGTIVDGSGATAFEGDVAIDGGVIVSVGGKAGPGREEIDAKGHLITPGWVDIHTHYDAQVLWDPYVSPSALHGVSTVVMGKCGVGVAPARPAHREDIVKMMEGIEEIPAAVLNAGLDWSWESFPEYLDSIERRPHVLDFATQVPHSALRLYVMGERGKKKDPASTGDIAAMADELERSLRAGALGFSTSRTGIHKTSEGRHIPGSFALPDELIGIAQGIQRAGHGVFQMVSDFNPAETEFAWMTRLSIELGIPVHFLVYQLAYEPTKYKDLLARTTEAVAAGADFHNEVGTRPLGMLITLESEKHPFSHHPAYQEIAHLPLAERVMTLRRPEIKARILAQETTQPDTFWRTTLESYGNIYRLGDPPEHEPPPEHSVAAIAAREGRTPQDVIYDMLLEREGHEILYCPLLSYGSHNFDILEEMLNAPRALVSLGDGGAHCGLAIDAGSPTLFLHHWGRDRSRGRRMPVEHIVHMQTRRTAKAFGLLDRGLLMPGYKADINVIDFPRLRLLPPEWAQDLPANGRRLTQRASGYRTTVVSGVVTTRDGEYTGALPGRLIRGPQTVPIQMGKSALAA
ncbi:MAG: amidohydrolase family protein [Proteobacteria bacterium]|nr:amidohydrolase family protein [Pseudomonadota bacterium]HQR02547.1 amidohydrolase family protein [Rhodocyclaceae bacterium]